MNHENFKLVLDTIKARPEEWEQRHWHLTVDGCQTKHCFAGWAQVLFEGRRECAYARGDAKYWLGLTEDQCEYLFAPHRNIEDFERFLAQHTPALEEEMVEAL